MNGINKIEVPQLVKVRKYPVNTEKLVEVLRNAKIEQDLTNSRIAFELGVPITTVEHWFRKDSSFAIPDEEIWFKLKNLLRINTYEFDESITIFEEKEGVYEKSNRFYFDNGIAPTITSASANEKIVQTLQHNDNNGIDKIRVIGNYSPSNHDASRIVDSDGLAPTVKENHGTITAIIENVNRNAKHQQDLIQSKEGICRTISAGTHGSTPHLLKTVTDEQPLRIRKLTPKECWRLMGFTDDDFEKAQAVPMSNTQLYKQAGNSIVVNVLEEILKNLI